MDLNAYLSVLRRKARRASLRGLLKIPPLNPNLFDYQADVTDYLLRAGSGAAFLDTGLGKSIISLDWGRVICEHTNRPVLMLAPLAVGPQHEKEARRFGIDARYIRTADQIGSGINITNYERLHLFSPSQFGGLILDESSIVKSYGGATSRALMAFAEPIKYRLACTATPAPNDHMELGQHSQLLGAMESNEMLARWFISDQSSMGKYRLKRYGVDDFWSWVASWARMASKPSDLGYSDDGFSRPGATIDLHYVDANLMAGAQDGELFRRVDTSATAIHSEKRRTAAARAERIAELVANDPNEAWCIWCDTDYEADELTKRIPEAIEVRGSMSADMKESRLVDFSEGRERVIVTKASIAGHGLNWQHCARCAFAGLSFSYEAFYQAQRRFDRFGQKRKVQIHIALAETEGVIWQTIQRKARDHEVMKAAMADAMRRAIERRECKIAYVPKQYARIPKWLKA
jgi:superfamily II DNA or RNA helicase